MSQGGILETLIEQLARLPGIGIKTAERLAYHLLKSSREEALALAEAIRRLKEELRECTRCHNVSELERCPICADESRDAGLICVVEQPKDLHVIEQSGSYRGLYFVLGGSFAPQEDRGPANLGVEELVQRIRGEGVREVILATNPDFEGDGTAMLVAESVAGTGVAVTRIARGVPAGSQIEYMNASIINDALEGRRDYGTPPRSTGEEEGESP